MSKWIPVSTPPDTRRYVLVFNGHHLEIQVGEYIPDHQQWATTFGLDVDDDISHWMELPTPPSAGESR